MSNQHPGTWSIRTAEPPGQRQFPRKKKEGHGVGGKLVCCLIVLVLIGGAAAGVYFLSRPTPFPTPPGPRLPVMPSDIRRYSGVLLGSNIDWTREDPSSFNQKIGHNFAIFDNYYTIGSDLEVSSLDRAARATASVGGIVTMTVQPSQGLSVVSDAALNELAKRCADLNANGVPTLVRFGHEMNGNWYAYGQRPEEFVSLFRRMAQAIRSATNQTAIVWAPNTAGGYPWGGQYTPERGDPRYTQMDTNHDGVVDDKDDPFLPYYPGDAYVDWVGISAYYFGPGVSANLSSQHPPNTIPPAGEFSRFIDPLYSFATERNKLFMVSETGIPLYVDSPGGPSEVEMKAAWVRQAYNATFLETHPNLRGILWFDFRKEEYNSMRDFSLTLNPNVTSVFSGIVEVAGRRNGTVMFAEQPLVNAIDVRG
ncbi:hypothetical protein HK104_007449 [Borealophlyctis nickersoniae]|nr:hypothetical protein HK104_007449 [Borealophlyctis nickersoniae]